MIAEHAEPSGELWLTITDLAARLGVRKSTVSEKVAALVADKVISTRPGKGKTKLVPVAAYLKAIGKTGDAAREAAAETRSEDTPVDVPAAPGYRDAQTREKQLAADLKQLELDERLGKLVEVETLAVAAQDAAELIAAAIDRLAINAEDMAAAVARDGTPGARAQYKRDARALRVSIAEAFKRFAAVSPATADIAVTVAVPSGQAWGDLDPADQDLR